MTTTPITGIGIGVPKGKATGANSSKTEDTSFASMMNVSLSERNKNSTADVTNVSGTKKEGVRKPSEKPDAGKTEKAEKEEQTGTSLSEEKKISAEKSKTEKPVEKVTAQEKTSDSESGEKLTEEVQNVLKKILELTKKVLGIDDEELNRMFEKLGITPMDLLSLQVVQQVVVEAEEGADFSVLLTNEDAALKFTELTNGIADIMEEGNLTPEVVKQVAESEDFVHLLADSRKVSGDSEGLEETSNEMLQEQKTETSLPKKEENTDLTLEKSFDVEVETDVRMTQKGDNRPATEQGKNTFASPQEQFIQHLEQASEGRLEETIPVTEQIREIADQILERVRVLIRPTQTSMEITLNPESLGKVSLNVVSKAGVMTASFTTQTEAARLAIESQMTVLRENLENQGIKVEAIEVSVSDFSFMQQGDLSNTDTGSGQQQNGMGRRRNLSLDEALSFEDVTEEEEIALDMMERNGNTVDYTA